MPFDPQIIAARLSLNLIAPGEMPQIAANALEASLDGPAIRQLASLEFPTFFEIQNLLPQALVEMRLPSFSKCAAAMLLARVRARQLLAGKLDPLMHLREFEQYWIEAGYPAEFQPYGTLDDQVSVARQLGEQDDAIRTRIIEALKELAEL